MANHDTERTSDDGLFHPEGSPEAGGPTPAADAGPDPQLPRRKFQHGALAAMAGVYGCGLAAAALTYLSPFPRGRHKESLDAGDSSQFAPGGEPKAFRLNDRLVWVLHDGEAIRAFDAKCTHFECNVVWPSPDEKDYETYRGSFKCRCHGARFDRAGRPTRPPAREPLRELEIADLVATNGKVVVLDRVKETG